MIFFLAIWVKSAFVNFAEIWNFKEERKARYFIAIDVACKWLYLQIVCRYQKDIKTKSMMILDENSLKQHLKPAFSPEQKTFFLNMYLHSPN